MPKVLVSDIDRSTSSSTPQHSPKALAALVKAFLQSLEGSKENALQFSSAPRVGGAGVSNADRELMLHYGARALIAESLSNAGRGNEALDLTHKAQWENLIAVLLARSSGSPSKALRTPAFAKACAAEVQTSAQVDTLAEILREVPDPVRQTPARAFVHGLLNTLEGQVASQTSRATAESELPSAARVTLAEFGRMLGNRLLVGAEEGGKFLHHELGAGLGFDAADREIMLYFAVQHLINASSENSRYEKASLPRGWSALFTLVGYLGVHTDEVINDTHSPMQRAFEDALRSGNDLSSIEKLAPSLGDDRHRIYASQLIAQARREPQRKLAA